MALDDRQRFKFGFLTYCADAGLTLEQTRELAKEAADMIRDQPTDELVKEARDKEGFSPVGVLGKLGLLGLVGAGGVGAGTGYLAAKMTESDVTPEEAKQQELIAAYQQMADRARRSMQMRRYRTAGAPRSPQLSFGH